MSYFSSLQRRLWKLSNSLKPRSFNFCSQVLNPFKYYTHCGSFTANLFYGYFTPKVLFESWTDTTFVCPLLLYGSVTSRLKCFWTCMLASYVSYMKYETVSHVCGQILLISCCAISLNRECDFNIANDVTMLLVPDVPVLRYRDSTGSWYE